MDRVPGYKKNFMLDSAEHEILGAHKYKKYQEIQLYSGSDKPSIHFFSAHKLLAF